MILRATILVVVGATVLTVLAQPGSPAAADSMDASPARTGDEATAPVLLLPAVFRRVGPDDLPPPRTAVPTHTAAPPTATPTLAPPTATGTATPSEPPPERTPGVPGCERTTGDSGGFRFSLDGGVTLAPTTGRLANIAYTWDLDVDPRDPDVILELHQRRVYRSTDAGCTFIQLRAVPENDWDRLEVAPSAPGVLVLTSVFSARLAYSSDGGNEWSVEELPDDVMALSIDPADPWHWTFVGRGPAIYTRAAADQRWTARPIPLEAGQSVIAAAYAPSRPDRWLVASATRGLVRTDDGGTTWEPASRGMFDPAAGSTEPTHAVVASSITFAPTDPQVVYAVANQVQRGGSLRSIWRSEDGGLTWSARVHDGDVQGTATARLTGGTRVFVAPQDPDRTYFAFGMAYDAYGTDLYRSPDGLRSFEASHFGGFYKVYTMAFGPSDTPVVFVGASSDIPSQ